MNVRNHAPTVILPTLWGKSKHKRSEPVPAFEKSRLIDSIYIDPIDSSKPAYSGSSIAAPQEEVAAGHYGTSLPGSGSDGPAKPHPVDDVGPMVTVLINNRQIVRYFIV